MAKHWIKNNGRLPIAVTEHDGNETTVNPGERRCLDPHRIVTPGPTAFSLEPAQEN